MLTFESIPQARVVRKGGQAFAPPPAPPAESQLAEHLRNAFAIALVAWRPAVAYLAILVAVAMPGLAMLVF